VVESNRRLLTVLCFLQLITYRNRRIAKPLSRLTLSFSRRLWPSINHSAVQEFVRPPLSGPFRAWRADKHVNQSVYSPREQTWLLARPLLISRQSKRLKASDCRMARSHDRSRNRQWLLQERRNAVLERISTRPETNDDSALRRIERQSATPHHNPFPSG
jgi:hypothetical protein